MLYALLFNEMSQSKVVLFSGLRRTAYKGCCASCRCCASAMCVWNLQVGFLHGAVFLFQGLQQINFKACEQFCTWLL